ncbi:MAG: DUF6576 domain-containing protein [Gemmataceae bacterium]
MRDPFAWSFPIGRLFGIGIRVHWLFPVLAVGLIVRLATKAYVPWLDASVFVLLIFFVVLLHEFGHCVAARWVNGDAREVLLWPLGGLAFCDVPHHPRAHFWTAAGGPLMNLVICAVAALVLGFAFAPGFQPPWNPIPDWGGWWPFASRLPIWGGGLEEAPAAALLVARLFYISWLLFLFNLVLVGYPMDSGRMLQSVLWPHVGYRQATLYSIYAGFGVVVLLCLACMIWDDVLLLFLALYIGFSCLNEWRSLEAGGEDSLFGYDFSQGYTSLERENPPEAAPPRPKKQNFIQRWLQRRAQRKLQREAEQRIADEKRMDELLEKIQQHGKHSLTDEEQRFLKKVAARYRNRS